jgi:hypothetical protein
VTCHIISSTNVSHYMVGQLTPKMRSFSLIEPWKRTKAVMKIWSSSERRALCRSSKLPSIAMSMSTIRTRSARILFPFRYLGEPLQVFLRNS